MKHTLVIAILVAITGMSIHASDRLRQLTPEQARDNLDHLLLPLSPDTIFWHEDISPAAIQMICVKKMRIRAEQTVPPLALEQPVDSTAHVGGSPEMSQAFVNVDLGPKIETKHKRNGSWRNFLGL